MEVDSVRGKNIFDESPPNNDPEARRRNKNVAMASMWSLPLSVWSCSWSLQWLSWHEDCGLCHGPCHGVEPNTTSCSNLPASGVHQATVQPISIPDTILGSIICLLVHLKHSHPDWFQLTAPNWPRPIFKMGFCFYHLAKPQCFVSSK